MGILRADRIAGLGGANAITGSTSFGGSGNHLKVEGIDNDFVTWWTADFTIEAWVFIDNFASWMYDDGNHFPAMVGHMNPTSDTNYWSFGPAENNSNNTLEFYYWKGSQNHTFVHTATIKENEWTHIAMSFSTSNGAKLFINGTGTSYISLSGTPQVSSSAAQFVVGQYNNQNISGNISNLRILKGTALYTSDFTPPTNRLEKTSDTKLLICNSASDVTHNDDEKIITSVRSSTNNSGPVASKFTPNSPVGFSTTTDVGSQYGSTFNGFGNFATSTYMVPPGGNTRERNRGRALFGGGSTIDNTIQSLIIQSQGNTIDFGDLSTGRYETECASSSTRGIWGGGYTESPNVKVDVIEFVTIANSSNTTDFGNLTVARGHLAGMCNSTRGVFANGSTDPGPNVNTLDYITIATAGNAIDFGDSTTASKPMGGGRSSTTRGIFTLGNAPSAVNTIEYITIATTANSQDFGDLTGFSGWGKGAGNISSGTRAILGGGHEALNNIEYITIASLGNGTDFGDLIVGRRSAFTAGSKTRGVFGGGKNPSQINNIEYVTIATTGNSLDFGDLLNKKSFASGLSDCHGGLSE